MEALLRKETVARMQSNQLADHILYAFPWDENGAIRFGLGGKTVIADDEALACEKGYAQGMWGWSGAARICSSNGRSRHAR